MATFTNQSKNSSTFLKLLRHGNDPRIVDLENTTFNDVVFSDGTILKDVTFAQLADQVWAKVTKNTSTFANISRN